MNVRSEVQVKYILEVTKDELDIIYLALGKSSVTTLKQSLENNLPYTNNLTVSPDDLNIIQKLFEGIHNQVYGYKESKIDE